MVDSNNSGVAVRGLVRCLMKKKDGAVTIALWKKILSRKPKDIAEHRRKAAVHYVELCAGLEGKARGVSS